MLIMSGYRRSFFSEATRIVRIIGTHRGAYMHGRRNRGVQGVHVPPPFLEGGYKRVHSVKVCVYPVVR